MQTMKRIFVAAALLCGCMLHAQMTTVTATNLRMAGSPIAAGTVSLTPVNAQGQPIAFLTGGGGGLNAPGAFSCTITSGAITGTCQVPDAALTTPANTLYVIVVTNSNNGQSFSMLVTGVTGITWALDAYAPPATT